MVLGYILSEDFDVLSMSDIKKLYVMFCLKKYSIFAKNII